MFNEKKRKSCRNTLVSDVNLTIQIRLTDFLIDVSTAWNFVRLYYRSLLQTSTTVFEKNENL